MAHDERRDEDCAGRVEQPARRSKHIDIPAIEEALRCKESGEQKVILTALCGQGHLDLPANDAYLSGAKRDDALSDAATASLPQAPAVR